MILARKQTCSNCEAKVDANADFCPRCGTPMAGGTRICGQCGSENRGDARFCKNCGQNLDQTQAPSVGDHRWLRGENDFAVRIEADDLKHLLRRQLKVELGTQALFIEGGALRETVAPGAYTLDTLPQRVREWASGKVDREVTVLLVDTVPTDLEFNLGGIFTNDPLRIGFTIQLQTEVTQPAKFLINLLRGRERYSIDDLRGYLYPQVTQMAEFWIRQYSAQELAENFSLRGQFELALEEALRTTFAQTGLHFLQIRAMKFNLEHLDRITGTLSKARLMDEELAADMLLAEAELEVALQTAEHEGKSELQLDEIHKKYELRKAEAELQFKKDYEKLNRELDLLTIVEETRKVEMEERRIALYARMRQAVLSDKMDEVRSEAEFEAFLDDVDKEKLIREKDRADMLRIWKEEAEDQDNARAHLLAKLEVERKYEVRAIELKLRSDLDEQELEAELRLERMRATQSHEIEFAKQEFEIKRRRAQAAYERERQGEEAQLQEEMTQAEIRQDEMRRKSELSLGADEYDEEIRQMRAELELGMDGLRGMKNIRLEEAERKWELDRQKLAFEWDQQQQTMEWEVQKQEREMEMEMQRERIKIDYELNRLDKLGKLGAEALISVSDVEQARVIADLKKTEDFKTMSEEQIMALVAKDSPEVARALQEKFKAIAEGQSSERERELYERLLAEQAMIVSQAREDADKRVTELAEALDKSAERAQHTAEHALDRIADTAQAFAKNKSEPTIVVTTPGTTGGVVYPPQPPGPNSGPGKTKDCPKCSKPVSMDARFCQHCQYEFPG